MPKLRTKSRRRNGYLGIDPGASGGIVFLPGNLKGIEYYEMPVSEQDLWIIIDSIAPSVELARVEYINPGMFGVHKSAAAKLYGSYMAVRMALTAAGIPFEEVQPVKTWQTVGVAKRKKNESANKWKDRLRAKAQQHFPKLDLWTKTKGLQLKVADALLIAHACRKDNMRK